MVGSDPTTNSLADSKSGEGFESEYMVGFDSASLASFVLGTLAGSESAHSATEEWFHPVILQSAEGNFQHYVH